MTLRKRQGNRIRRSSRPQPQHFTNRLLEGVPLERMLKPHLWNSRVRSTNPERCRAKRSQLPPSWARFLGRHNQTETLPNNPGFGDLWELCRAAPGTLE